MIRLFKKRSTTRSMQTNLTDKAANKVAGVLLGIQLKISNILNRSFSKMPTRRSVSMLIAFCVLSGGFSIYTAVDAVITSRKRVTSIDKIKVLSHATPGNDKQSMAADTISDDMYTTIQVYKNYMDSLGLAIRPGLADSIRIIEQNYQAQKNK